MKIRNILKTNLSMPIILIRLIAGSIFLSEGIQKFLFADSLGIGRFIKIGIIIPEFFAPFVGVLEIICGVLILIGFLTRLAAIPMIIDMIAAISTTKIPILINEGFWKAAHEARTDWAMLFSSIFLLIAGAGKFSIDYYLSKSKDVKS